jgi:acyl-CoA synthetase (NDP forming)
LVDLSDLDSNHPHADGTARALEGLRVLAGLRAAQGKGRRETGALFAYPAAVRCGLPDFSRLISPRAVAIVGASADLSRIGGQPVRANTEFGFRGGVYPVNPKYGEVAGLRSYPDLASVPRPCDVALIALAAPQVASTIRMCGEASIPFAVVLSAGFGELGERGGALARELRDAIASSGVRVVGPNCQGILNFRDKFYGGFGSIFQDGDMRSGSVAMVTQSGGFGYGMAQLAEDAGVGFNYIVSTGNEADLTALDLIEYSLERDDVSLIATYLEGVKDGRRLAALGRRALELRKPIVVWKVGNTRTGRRAAASHTGNLTGDYDLYRTAFRAGGFIEIGDLADLIDVAQAVEMGRFPEGDRVGVISISGGAGVLLADHCERAGLELPQPAPERTAELRTILPDFSSLANPIDVTAQVFNQLDIYARAVEIVRDDPGVDQLILYNASVPDPAAERVATALVPVIAGSRKPVFVAWAAPPDRAARGMAVLRASGIAIYPTPARAAFAAASLTEFARRVRRGAPPVAARPAHLGSPAPLPPGEARLGERAAQALLAPYGIRFARSLAVSLDRLPEIEPPPFAFPVVLKIDAPGLAHKTELGGVRTGLSDLAALRSAAAAMVSRFRDSNPNGAIDGVLIAETLDGIEVIAGLVNDRVFGPTVVLGLGGIFAETLHDASRRFAPIGRSTAREMIGELRAAAVLRGTRTGIAYDLDALADLLVGLSWFGADHADRLVELDLNPVFVRPAPHGALAADALIVVRETASS